MLRRPSAALALALIAGCGGPHDPKPGPTSPHNGSLVDLPDGLGFVEIVRERDPAKPGRARIVAYFLDPSKGPLADATGVKLTSQSTGGKPVDLKPVSGGDAASSGGLTTPPLPDGGELDGEMTATIGGKAMTIPLNVR